jgi:FixJ family two-component response regulator
MAGAGTCIPSSAAGGKQTQKNETFACVTAGPKRRRDASISTRKTHAKRAAEAASVVLVDDDPSVLRALSRLIQTAGFRVLSFDRPSALLVSAIPTANACLVVDINLPEMSGPELCSALAASGRGLPAVLITGRDDSSTQRLIEQAHPVAALFKPVDERTLFDAIARALSRSDG